jgi:hypothetical protein
MIHPDTYLKITNKGLGVFTKRQFNRGEILWIVDDQDLKYPLKSYNQLEPSLLKRLNVYSYLDSTEKVIIPWDEGKYVNHSCSPNSLGLTQFDNISIAIRTIEEGEEIVEDYDCYYGHFESFPCLCGSSNCRQMVNKPNKEIRTSRMDISTIIDEILSFDQELLKYNTSEVIQLKMILEEHAKSVAA